MEYDDPNQGDDFYPDASLVSECCGAHPLGETNEALMPDGSMIITGICSECHDHASFTQEAEEE